MPRIIFWDVDTQHDFIRADGKLYVGGSEEIVPALAALTEFAHARGIPIVASADDHLPGHRELSDAPDFRDTFPPHCMRGTPGQLKIPETALDHPLAIEPEPQDPAALAARIAAHRGDFLLLKHWFDVFTNANVQVLLRTLAPTDIVLYGVALDVCNRYAIDGLLANWPTARLWLVADATRAIHPESVPALLEDWRQRSVHVVESGAVLAGQVPA